MAIDWVRQHCLSLPHTTETVQWGYDLVFKIGGKMYSVMPLEPAPVCLSFKCSPEDFAELIERPGVIPAPYLARAHWVALEANDALPRAELKQLLRKAYDLVLAKLPKKTQAALGK
jgi:predicted DNA-binding protein (MmcQ/YjbR family)